LCQRWNTHHYATAGRADCWDCREKGGEKRWRYYEIDEYYKSNIEDEILRERLLRLLRWAKEKEVFYEETHPRKYPMLRLKVRTADKPVMSVYTDGRIEVSYGVDRRDAYKSEADRRRLWKEFIELGLWLAPAKEPDKLDASGEIEEDEEGYWGA